MFLLLCIACGLVMRTTSVLEKSDLAGAYCSAFGASDETCDGSDEFNYLEGASGVTPTPEFCAQWCRQQVEAEGRSVCCVFDPDPEAVSCLLGNKPGKVRQGSEDEWRGFATVCEAGLVEPGPLREPWQDEEWLPAGNYQFAEKLFGLDGARPSDIVQGSTGDCWLLSSMASVARFPGTIRRLFRQQFKSDSYDVQLYDGERERWRGLTVTDYVPTAGSGANKVFVGSSGTGKLWPVLLEKAAAKLFRHHRVDTQAAPYALLIANYAGTGLVLLTGATQFQQFGRHSGTWARDVSTTPPKRLDWKGQTPSFTKRTNAFGFEALSQATAPMSNEEFWQALVKAARQNFPAVVSSTGSQPCITGTHCHSCIPPLESPLGNRSKTRSWNAVHRAGMGHLQEMMCVGAKSASVQIPGWECEPPSRGWTELYGLWTNEGHGNSWCRRVGPWKDLLYGLPTGHAFSLQQVVDLHAGPNTVCTVDGRVVDPAQCAVGRGELDARSVEAPARLLQLLNPYAFRSAKEYTGPWSDGDGLWAARPDVAAAVGYEPKSDGSFWIPFDVFADRFGNVQVANVDLAHFNPPPVKMEVDGAAPGGPVGDMGPADSGFDGSDLA